MPGAEVKADLWVNEYITPWDIYQHGITKVRAAASTEWQDMQIVETGVYGLGLVLDGKWQSCTGDEFLYHEPLVHPAMVFRTMNGRAPKNVLVLGGGEGATVREILRWTSVERVTMVDIDGEVVEACRQHMPEMHKGAFDDPRTDLVIANALEYIKDKDAQPEGGWDVIISDLSDPIEDGPSFQLFTKEYYEDLKAILAPGGELVVQAGPVTPAELRLHCRLVRTLSEVFPRTVSLQSFVPTYCAPWSFVICSDEELPEIDTNEIDDVIEANTKPFGGTTLKVFDGEALFGMMALPKHLREAIASEDQVYTAANPPKAFGSETTNAMSV